VGTWAGNLRRKDWPRRALPIRSLAEIIWLARLISPIWSSVFLKKVMRSPTTGIGTWLLELIE